MGTATIPGNLRCSVTRQSSESCERSEFWRIPLRPGFVDTPVEMQTPFQHGRAWRNLVFVFSCVLAFSGGLAARGATPQWIIGTNEDGSARRLSKSFSVEGPVQGAELKLAADFCTAT